MISHQEASVQATSLDSGAGGLSDASGAAAGPMVWIKWLLDKWRIEDEAEDERRCMLPRPPAGLQPARRNEDYAEEEEAAEAKARRAESTPAASSSSTSFRSTASASLWPSPTPPLQRP